MKDARPPRCFCLCRRTDPVRWPGYDWAVLRMAGCGEVDQSVNMLPSSRKGGGEACSGPGSSSPALPVPECAICLQTCVHPVRLPCRHVFCFLCVKGASWQSKRCALCRQEVPEDFLERPTLLSPEELRAAGRGHGDYAWYYEGRNGWWQYDERTSRELEDAYAKGKKSTEMLIAGFLYVADLENMVQYRRNEHSRRRRMKRDIVDIPKKGVAGLRLDTETGAATPDRDSSADGADAAGSQAGSVQAPTSPTSPSTDSSSVESSLAQLHISLPARQHQPRAEEEEDEDEEDEGGEVAPNTSVDESESGSSEEEEYEYYGREEADHDRAPSRQGLPLQVNLRESQGDLSPPGAESSSSSGGAGSSSRSRRPDGQCTVTEV
nr:E3 ubiquitin-protein ligase RNF146-B-like isoform X1 [Paramormyrops kingsleyae]